MQYYDKYLDICLNEFLGNITNHLTVYLFTFYFIFIWDYKPYVNNLNAIYRNQGQKNFHFYFVSICLNNLPGKVIFVLKKINTLPCEN